MRFAMRALGLLTVVAAMGAAPSDPLAAIARANGHLAAVHLRASATRTVEGRTVVTTLEQLGTARLFRRCVAEVCGGIWFDGRRLWRFGLNEVPLPEAVDAATRRMRTFAAIASLAFAEPDFVAAGGVVSPQGPARWRVRASGGDELIAVLDPATLALRRVETPRGETLAEYGPPVRAGGASFALRRDGPEESGPLDAVSVLAGPLEPPNGAAAAFGDDAWTPLADPALPVIACSLGGVAARCLLDSGSTPSSVTLALAERLGLEPRGELQIESLGSFATGFVEAGPLVAGGASFARARFAVVPAERAARFDVVVGADLLGRVELALDGARRRARVSAPGPAPPGAIPLDLGQGVPLVGVALDGAPVTALLDTGDEATFSLGYAMYREGPQWPPAGRVAARGVVGAEDAFLVDIPDVRAGARDLGRVRAVVQRTQVVPHLGDGAWARSGLTLDEAAGAFWFEAPKIGGRKTYLGRSPRDGR